MNDRRLPGERIRAVAATWLDEPSRRHLIDNAVADLQYEVREAGAHRWRRLRVLARGRAACVRVLIVALVFRRSAMKRVALALAGCALVALSIAAGMHKTATHVVFIIVCAFYLSPFVLAVWLVGRRWSKEQAARLALVAVPLWFIAGAAIGWALVPDAWPGSLSLTIDAAMGAAIYGDQFENLAEGILMYPMLFGVFGAIAAAALSLVALRVATIDRGRGAEP